MAHPLAAATRNELEQRTNTNAFIVIGSGDGQLVPKCSPDRVCEQTSTKFQ